MNTSADPQQPIAERARRFAPVVWLLGKVQSGKTSIIRALTQASDAEIGSGFRACTQDGARVRLSRARRRSSASSIRAGLGEVAYDPAEDIAFCEGRSHLILAVVKALDLEQQRGARRHPRGQAAPSGMAGRGGADEPARGLPRRAAARLALSASAPPGIAAPLRRIPCCVRSAYQRSLFQALPGRGAPTFVPIDFTQAGDGFEPTRLRPRGPDRGADRRGARCRGRRSRRAAARARRRAARKSNAHILGFALAAGASDAVPRRRRSSPCRWCRRPCCGSSPSCYGAQLGQAGLCGIRRRARRRHAGAHGFHLRRAPARQAHPGLRPDRRRGGCGRRELRRHLRHGQGRQLFPDRAPARPAAPRRSRPSTATPCSRPFAWRRSATSAAARGSQAMSKPQAASSIPAPGPAGRGPAAAGAQPDPARQSLALAARLHPLLGDRDLRRRRRRLLPARSA